MFLCVTLFRQKKAEKRYSIWILLHVHVVVPGGGVDKRRRQWKKKKGKYLFNKKAMAKVFRARFLTALNKAGFSIPKRVPEEWVVDCTCVGKGITALKYLSRYLYRGVISEKNIVSNQNGEVTFKYIESKTGNTLYRTLKVNAIWQVKGKITVFVKFLCIA